MKRKTQGNRPNTENGRKKKEKPLDYNSQKDKTMTSMRNEQDVLQRTTRH